MTLGQLETVLTVASLDNSLSLVELSEIMKLDYGAGAQHVAQIAEGKNKAKGQRLLRQIPGPTKRTKLVSISRTGKAVACRFAPSEEREIVGKLPAGERNAQLSEHLKKTTLPAVRTMTSFSPVMSLGSFCVLLYITTHQNKIAFEGPRVSDISEELGISNVPRHLTILGAGNLKRKGFGLVEFEQNSKVLRVTLPRPSQKCLDLMMPLASALLQRPAKQLRQPKAEAAQALPTPEDIKTLLDEDFNYFSDGGLEGIHV